MGSPPPVVGFFDAYPHLLGGAQQTLLALARELTQRGRVPAVFLPGEGLLAERARTLGIPVAILDTPPALRRYGRSTTGAAAVRAAAALPRMWVQLRRLISRAGLDVMHVNDHRGILLAAPAAAAARTPVVWHAHAVDVSGTFVERTVGRLCGAVVAPSRAALSALRGLSPRVPRVVVGGAVDRSVLALAPATPSGSGSIVMAARLHPQKGVDVAIRAVAELISRGVAAHLDIYGGPQPGAEHYASELTDLIAALNVRNAVTLHGHVDAPQRGWLTADVYIQPSRAETFGMALVEAMSLGLPVVATRVGGLSELIDDGRTGSLVPPDDPVALADAIQALLGDRDRARAHADAARADAARYSPERLVDELLPVWERVIR